MDMAKMLTQDTPEGRCERIYDTEFVVADQSIPLEWARSGAVLVRSDFVRNMIGSGKKLIVMLRIVEKDFHLLVPSTHFSQWPNDGRQR